MNACHHPQLRSDDGSDQYFYCPDCSKAFRLIGPDRTDLVMIGTMPTERGD